MNHDETTNSRRKLPPALERLLGSGSVRQVYDRVRAERIIISGYDVTSHCNLRCEGCHYFEGPHAGGMAEVRDAQSWRKFFEAERARGITFPHIAGAEPALVPGRLEAAARVFDQGLVYTNGSLPIDSDLPFMLHISLWGGRETDARFRGPGILDRAVELYGGDPRAVFMYTIHHHNIGEIAGVARLLHDHGARISFNHYSPTRQYLERLSRREEAGGRTFSRSSAADNLCLTAPDLQRVRSIVGELMDEFPDTVVYSRYYNEVVNTPGSLFELDPLTGVARDCPILNKPYHRQYRADLTWDDRECCVPRVACAECRVYASVYTRIMDQMKEHMESTQRFACWLDVMDAWLALHVRGYERTDLLGGRPATYGPEVARAPGEALEASP